jgi:hypothetical protein
MGADAGRRWGSGDQLEGYVRDRLVNYPHFFKNHEGDDLPLMSATIPGQFNRSGHGIDIMALDQRRTLWIIEVSRGSTRGAALIKQLGTRKDGNAQMSPAWRTQKKDKFLELPNSYEKLVALFDAQGMSEVDVLSLFDSKLNDHRVAIVVPDGCHVEGLNTGVSFGQEIYTFFVSEGIRLHTRGKRR